MKGRGSIASILAGHAGKWIVLLAIGMLALVAPLAATDAAAATKAAATKKTKGPPDLSGVWAVVNAVTVSGRSAMAAPPMSKQGEAIVNAFRSQYNLKGMEPN